MSPAERRRVTPDGWSLALSPPLALVVGVAASFVVAFVAALVWHTRWPNPADAEMMRWQEAATVRGDGIATAIADAVGPLVVLVVLAGVALAWRVKRWDAVVLALVAAPGTLVIELLLKQVVHRQRPDSGAALLYPSGHVAVATAAAVTAVLVAQGNAGTTADNHAHRLAGGLARGRHRRGASGADRPLRDRRHWRRRPRARRDLLGGAGDHRGVPIGAAYRGSIALPGRRDTSRPGTTNAFRATPRARTDLDDLGSTAAGSTGMPRVPRPSPPRPRRSRRQPGTPSN